MDKHSEYTLIAALLVTAVVAGGCSKSTEITPTRPATPASVSNVSDIDVTEHVKTALSQSESLKGYDISVVTLKGDVRLIGVVATQAQVDEVIRIARASDGVHSIHDELTVRQ